jgi:hypothetical protein
MNIPGFLGHIDMMPVFYGIVIFLGLYSILMKLLTLRLISFTVEVAVFCLVFQLHGGTMAGGFAATIAAWLAGCIFPRRIRKSTGMSL